MPYNKTLVPCMIEPCERPIMFELTQTAELSHWEGDASDKAWAAFLADVKRVATKEKAPALAPADLLARHEEVQPQHGEARRAVEEHQRVVQQLSTHLGVELLDPVQEARDVVIVEEVDRNVRGRNADAVLGRLGAPGKVVR